MDGTPINTDKRVFIATFTTMNFQSKALLVSVLTCAAY